MVEISKLPKAWENASGDVANCVSFAFDWLKKMVCELSTNHRATKKKTREIPDH